MKRTLLLEVLLALIIALWLAALPAPVTIVYQITLPAQAAAAPAQRVITLEQRDGGWRVVLRDTASP